ncbi:MAG: hypothetical protein IJW24_01160 [Clostridia bacterium]|nr:hypothetical protein [Clostridia bacterium]
MKLKNKLKNIFACVLLVVALLCSCSFQTLTVVGNQLSLAAAKEYEAENKVDPYEFTTSSQWSKNSNYSNQKDPADDTKTVNAFDGTKPSVDITSLETNKPSTKYDGSTTSPAEGEEVDIDNYVMMITADGAETKQLKDKKDDDNKTVYNNRDFVLDSDDKVKFYSADDIDESNEKYLPVDADLVEEMLGLTTPKTEFEGQTGKYVEMKPVKVWTDVYYYYRSNSISLAKQGYYVISFWMYTSGDAEATVKVATSDGKKFEAIKSELKSEGEWTQVYLFLETRAVGSAPSVYISLYMGDTENIAGSKTIAEPDSESDSDFVPTKVTGTVFFDNLCVKTINQTDFIAKTVNGTAPSADAVVDSYSAREKSFFSGLIANNQFDNSVEDYKTTTPSGDYDWKYFVPEFSLSDVNDETPTLVKEMYKNVYAGTDFSLETVSESTIKLEDTDPIYNTFANNNNVLKMQNKNQSYDLGIVSAPFEIDQFAYYRISFWVKALDEDSSATVALFGNIKSGETKVDGTNILKTQTIANLYTEPAEDADEEKDDDKMDMNNGWTEVVFFVHGNAYRDMNVELVVLANKNSTVYVDHIQVESVLSSDFSSASSSNKLELSPSSLVANRTISNGYFNSITTEDYDHREIKAPYKAQNWTLNSDNDEEVVAGIVPTNANYNAEKIGGAANPNGDASSTISKTNVYAIHAPALSAEEKAEDSEKVGRNFEMTSSSFSLSSSSVYKVKFNLFICSENDDNLTSNFTGKIKVYLTYSDDTVAEFVIDGSSATKNTWLEYTFLTRSGSSSRSTKLTIDISDAQGTVFFKQIGLYQMKETERTVDGEKVNVSPDELFVEQLEKNSTTAERLANRTYVVDYASYSFTMHSNDFVTETIPGEGDADDTVITKAYYESFSHKVVMKDEKDENEKKTHGIVGVVDTTGTVKLSDTLTLSDISNANAKTDRALLIYNASALSTKVTSKTTFNLAKTSYYTIDVYVKTSIFAENQGLEISMSAISVKFEKIDTSTIADNNGYDLYRAIVATGDEAVSGLSVDFVLGTDNNKLEGYALVSDVVITKLADKDAYDELVDEVADDDAKTVVKNFYTDSEAESDSTPTDSDTLTVFFLVFSSILMVLALGISLVAVFIKKHPKKKTVKVDSSENKFQNKKTRTKETVDSDKGGFVE